MHHLRPTTGTASSSGIGIGAGLTSWTPSPPPVFSDIADPEEGEEEQVNGDPEPVVTMITDMIVVTLVRLSTAGRGVP